MGITIKGELSQPQLEFINDYIRLNFLDLCIMESGKYFYKEGVKFIKQARYKLVIEVE